MSGTCSSSGIKLKEREKISWPDMEDTCYMNPINLKMISPVRFQLNCFVEVFFNIRHQHTLKINKRLLIEFIVCSSLNIHVCKNYNISSIKLRSISILGRKIQQTETGIRSILVQLF